MRGGGARCSRRWMGRALVACLASAASGAWAQVQPEPLPPQPDTTTIEEEPAPVPMGEPVSPAPPEPLELKRSPPDARGIPLSTVIPPRRVQIETRRLREGNE